MAALSILLASGFLLLVAYAIYDDCYGRRSWKDKDLSEFVVARAYMDDTYRVYNYLEGKYTTPRLSWICDTPEGDSLTVYALPGTAAQARGAVCSGRRTGDLAAG